MTDTAVPLTTKKDWSSDQEVRWCPGCGDYSILTAVQLLMPELGVKPESTVFLSGIGCAARFPYYMNTYGMHSIHGRAPAIATGLAMARPDLDVWVITGDVDDADLLVLGWGSTWGAIDGAVNRVRAKGRKVAHAQLRHLHPFPKDLGDVLARYPQVLVPEMNLGQLSRLVRAEYLVDAQSVHKVRGVPFTAGELEAAILDTLGPSGDSGVSDATSARNGGPR